MIWGTVAVQILVQFVTGSPILKNEIFVIKCVSQLHQVHIPLEKYDLFMCNDCYKECDT